MPQPPLLDLSALIVKDRDLLKPRMKITTYNQHDVGSFSSLGLFLANQSTRTCEPTSLCNQAKRGICSPCPYPQTTGAPRFAFSETWASTVKLCFAIRSRRCLGLSCVRRGFRPNL